MPTSRTAPLRLTEASRLTVGSSETRGTNISCHGVIVKAICPGQTVYLDKYNAASRVTTAVGFPLADGDTIDLAVKNVNELDFIASAAGQSVALLPYSLY